MSIATYSELQTAVGTYLDDTSLSSLIPDWITMAESRINRDMSSLRTSLSTAVLTGTIDLTYIALPADFVEVREVLLTTDGASDRLVPFVVGTIDYRETSGTPKMYGIVASQVQFDCPLDQAHTFNMLYRVKWELSDGSPTNWILTNHPDLYLAATLVEAYAFRGNETAALRWEQRYRMAAEEIDRNESRNLAIAPLQIDAALRPVGRAFNYTTGQ